MRRTLAIAIAAGIGAIAAVSMALLVPSGAGAAQAPTDPTAVATTTRVDGLCIKLPGLQANVTDGLARSAAAHNAAEATVADRRASMFAATTELADAIVTHLSTLDSGGDSGASGAVLKSKQAGYVTAVVGWSQARTQAFDAERDLAFDELEKTLLDSLQGSACP